MPVNPFLIFSTVSITITMVWNTGGVATADPTMPKGAAGEKPDPIMVARSSSTLAREGSIGVVSGGNSAASVKQAWELKGNNTDDSLESIGVFTGFDNDAVENHSPSTLENNPKTIVKRQDSSASDGSKRRVSFSRDVKAAKHGPETEWYRDVLDKFSGVTLRKCALQCGNGVKALDSVLSEGCGNVADNSEKFAMQCGNGVKAVDSVLSKVALCACGNVAEKSHGCAQCGAARNSYNHNACDGLGEENDLVWRGDNEDFRGTLLETRNVIQESRDAIVATRIAVTESRDAILGSYEEMRESRQAIQETRHAITDCHDSIMRSRADPIEQHRRSHLNIETGMGRGMHQGEDPFSASMHANQRKLTPKSILRRKGSSNVAETKKSTAEVDKYGVASAIPNSPLGRFKHNKKNSSQRQEESTKKNGNRMRRGVTRLIAGSIKGPLKFVSHRMKNSGPKRVLAIREGPFVRRYAV